MADEKKPVDSLLSSLEEIKRQTSEPAAKKGGDAPGKKAEKPSSKGRGDILGSLLSEVKREADEEKARLDQTLASREEEKLRRAREEEDEKRLRYQKLVEEESGRRQAQLRQKEDRARQVILDEEARKKSEAEKAIRAKAMVELEKKRKRQRVVNLVVAAVVVIAAGVALTITRPWERTEPLKGIDAVKSDKYVAKKADFTPLYNASDRGDPTFVEPRSFSSEQTDKIPAIEAFSWLGQRELTTVKPDHKLPRAKILLADADSYRTHLEQRFSKMKWIESEGRPHRGGSNSVKKPGGDGLELDLSAFGQKDKKKKKK